MNSYSTPTPYPWEEFHLVSREGIEEVVRHVQAPVALIAMEFLANMSAATQGIFDVHLPTGKTCPTSLYLAVIAESGERKTEVHNRVAARLYEFDREREAKHDADRKQYELAMTIWEDVNKGLRRQLTKLTRDGESVEELCRQLAEHTAAKPEKPRKRRLMRQDVSARGTMDALEGDGESIAFFEDEGENVIKGGAFQQTGRINDAWGGSKTLTIDRGYGVSIVARNPRVTVSFMIQPLVLEEYLHKRGKYMRGSGHWARYLMAYPASTQGTRFTYDLKKEWVHLPKFHARMRELLDEFGRRSDVGVKERSILEFDEDARSSWVEFSNKIESQLTPLGYLHDIKDFASKSMEVVGRIAALFHVFSKQEGKISVDTLNRAVSIVDWHLHEFKRLFSPEFAIPQEQADAQVLEEYFYTKLWNRNYSFTLKNAALKNGPIRPATRFNAALDFLIELGRVWVNTGPKGAQYINLNPVYFGSRGGLRPMPPQFGTIGFTLQGVPGANSVIPLSSNNW